MLADLQAHVDPRADWYNCPLDRLWSVYERWQDGERRKFALAVTTGQLGMLGLASNAGEIADKIIKSGERLCVPNPSTPLDGNVSDAMPSPQTPYPVPPAVAAALGEALAAGLLSGEAWASWPASPDGLPLCRIWGRMEATAGLVSGAG